MVAAYIKDVTLDQKGNIQHNMLRSCPAFNVNRCKMFSGLADLGYNIWNLFLNLKNRTQINVLLSDLTDHKIGDEFDLQMKTFLKTVLKL